MSTEKIIAEGFGCQIIKRESKLYIKYDNGEAVSKMVENEITSEEAKKAMMSDKDAYQVIIEAQRREGKTYLAGNTGFG